MHAGAAALTVILVFTPIACGSEKSASDYARDACGPLTKKALGSDSEKLKFLQDKERLASTAANKDPRWKPLAEAKHELRRSTEEGNSQAALAAGVRVLEECGKVPSD